MIWRPSCPVASSRSSANVQSSRLRRRVSSVWRTAAYLFGKNSSCGLTSDLLGFTDATSNDGFCAGAVCGAKGMTMHAMLATINRTLFTACRILSFDQ